VWEPLMSSKRQMSVSQQSATFFGLEPAIPVTHAPGRHAG
jgi:hypothetical protein